jgi:hypothetical protein
MKNEKRKQPVCYLNDAVFRHCAHDAAHDFVGRRGGGGAAAVMV